MSGSSATALIQAGNCYTAAIQLQGNTSSMECFATGALKTLQTAQIGVMESFVGVLPASLMTSVQSTLVVPFSRRASLTKLFSQTSSRTTLPTVAIPPQRVSQLRCVFSFLCLQRFGD